MITDFNEFVLMHPISKSGLLFTTASGKPINPRFLVKKFKQAIAGAGVIVPQQIRRIKHITGRQSRPTTQARSINRKLHLAHKSLRCRMSIAGAINIKGKQRTCVARNILHDASLTRTTIYFNHYLFETFRLLEQPAAFFSRMVLWFDLAGKGFKTTPEQLEPTRSDCHGRGAHPLYHYFPAHHVNVLSKTDCFGMTAGRSRAKFPGFVDYAKMNRYPRKGCNDTR